jgi:HPt (histidine-containing phosphotransfer) domain-containing protein
MQEDRLYDLAQLRELAGGNEEFVQKMVHMFITMVPEFTGRIKDSLHQEDYEDIGSAAHKLKPSIDMLGILSLKQKIRDLEQSGKKREHLDHLPALMAEIIQELGRVCDQLANQ